MDVPFDEDAGFIFSRVLPKNGFASVFGLSRQPSEKVKCAKCVFGRVRSVFTKRKRGRKAHWSRTLAPINVELYRPFYLILVK
jgi:hypothetical protein